MSRAFAPFSLITKKVIKWLQDHVKLHFKLHFGCMFIETCCGQNYGFELEKFSFYRRWQWQNPIIFVCLFGRPLLIVKCSTSVNMSWYIKILGRPVHQQCRKTYDLRGKKICWVQFYFYIFISVDLQ